MPALEVHGNGLVYDGKGPGSREASVGGNMGVSQNRGL